MKDSVYGAFCMSVWSVQKKKIMNTKVLFMSNA